MYYLAYGSNLNIKAMKRMCPNAVKIGSALIKGYKLVLNKYFDVIKDDNSLLPVGIWQIDAKDEVAIDRYEDYPRLYRKEYLNININGKEEKALIYMMNYPINVKASKEYLDMCIKGYEDFNLDKKYIMEAIGE